MVIFTEGVFLARLLFDEKKFQTKALVIYLVHILIKLNRTESYFVPMYLKLYSFALKCFIAFTLLGCSMEHENHSENEIDYSSIQVINLEKEFSITASDNYVPSQVRSIMVHKNGTILVSERNEKSIHQFDHSGNYVAKVARSGRGPGELSRYSMAHFNGEVLVMSQNDGKLSEFRPNENGIYTFFKDYVVRMPGPVRGIRYDKEFNSAYVTVDSVRTPYGIIPSEFTTDFVHIVSIKGDSLEVEENVLSLKRHSPYIKAVDGGMLYNSLPYRYTDYIQPIPEEKLLVQRPSQSAIQIYDENIDLEHELILNIADRPVTEDDYNFHFSELSSSERADRRSLIKDSKPPFTKILMDDEQRFWLETDQTTEGIEYVILSYKGSPLGRVFLPKDNVLHTVMNNRLYVFNRVEATIDVYSVKLDE